ncbi:MAG: hypothetical protein KY450_11350 [Actinobacteria bacterium]|nr:hypothetical protein [Actinomycetota bacterium]
MPIATAGRGAGPAGDDVSLRQEGPRDGSLGARPSWWPGALAVVVAFVVSRVVVAAAGVRFDTDPLASGFQVLELTELRDNLFGSLTHLHAQPPLFNLFIGLVLRLPQAWEQPVFRLVYLGAGLSLALTIFTVLVRLGLRRSLAVLLTLVVTLSPANILFENWAHYDYLVVLLLCLSVLALQRYEDDHRLRHVAVFFGLSGVLVLTRSMFQLVWFLAWTAVLVVHRRRADWKHVAIVASVPLLAIVAVYANTFRVAGSFTSSTSLGISLAKITTFQLPETERRAMVDQGALSPLALVPPQAPVPGYAGVVPPAPTTGVPVLDEEVKTFADGTIRTNYNNLLYAEVSEAYLDDAVRTLRTRPDAYARGVATATELFFRPPSDFFTLRENRTHIAEYNRLYNHLFYGVVASGDPISGFPDVAQQYRQGPPRTGWLSIVLYVVALVGGAIELCRRRDRRRPGHSSLLLGFLWSTVAYVVAVSNLLEVGENDRFRLYTEPLVLLLVVALAGRWLARRRERDSGHEEGEVLGFDHAIEMKPCGGKSLTPPPEAGRR